ncbi:MAG: hypothetical protein JW838_13750 [Spirochaetes bacterium]|nr:hypothetical protein [Spirochaetota bacterium]
MKGSEKRFYRLARKGIIILLLVAASGAGIFLSKDPGTRSWGLVLFILSFVWLYAYVVKRRTTAGK